MSAGKAPVPPEVLARIPKALARLKASASGYIRTMKFGVPDRMALSVCIERGQVELFKSPLGRAYRLVQRPDCHMADDCICDLPLPLVLATSTKEERDAWGQENVPTDEQLDPSKGPGRISVVVDGKNVGYVTGIRKAKDEESEPTKLSDLHGTYGLGDDITATLSPASEGSPFDKAGVVPKINRPATTRPDDGDEHCISGDAHLRREYPVADDLEAPVTEEQKAATVHWFNEWVEPHLG